MASRSSQSPLEIRVDESSTTATLFISEKQDTITLELPAVMALLAEKRVEITPDIEATVAAIVADFKENPRRIEEVIHRAIPAQHGKDAYFDWSPGMDPTAPKRMQPTPEAGEAVDFYNLTSMIRVKPGDHVATFHEAEQGQHGRDIYGRVAEARPGKPSDVSIDASLTKHPDGRIIANIGGALELKANTLRISRMMEVQGYVDFSTGNIKFDGSIHVREGVRDRFEITASEDVLVEGLIEAATISAGRNFLSRRGMAARNLGQIRIDGNAEAGFLNNVRGYVRGDLIVRREIMNCDLAVGGHLNAQDGVILGGTIAVMRKARVGVVGSEGGIVTTLSLGAAPLTLAEIRQIDEHLAKLHKAIEQRGGASLLALATAPQGKLKRSAPDAQLLAEIEQINSRIAAAEARKEQLNQQLRSERTIELHIMKMLHAKTRLRAFETSILVGESIKGPLVILWDPQNGLHYRQGTGGAPKPIPPLQR